MNDQNLFPLCGKCQRPLGEGFEEESIEPGTCSECFADRDKPPTVIVFSHKALSLLQPWPWSIFRAGKNVENRTWKLPEWMDGQRVILHASKGWDDAGADYLLSLYAEGKIAEKPPSADELPRGCIVGECTLRHCYSEKRLALPSHWEFGPWCWGIEDVLEYKTTIATRGFPGFFDVPDDLVQQARAA